MPVAGNAISMSQANVELGRSATAPISFLDSKFRAMCAVAGVAGVVAHDNETVSAAPVSFANARGRKAWSFQVSGTGAFAGTAPNRARQVGWSSVAGTGAQSGAKPTWVSEARMTEYEAASANQNYIGIVGPDDTTGVSASQVRALHVGGAGAVGIAWGQGDHLDTTAGDYISEGWGSNAGAILYVADGFGFAPGGTTDLTIFSDG